MIVFGKVVVFGQKWLYSDRSSCIRSWWLYFCKCGCIRAKEVVFGPKWLYSGKIVVIGQSY